MEMEGWTLRAGLIESPGSTYHLSSPLGILHPHQIKLELEVLGQLGQQVYAEPGAALPVCLIVGPADPTANTPVNIALVRHVVGPGQVDEGRLLQVADSDVELLRHPGGRDVALPGPHDVLDVEAVVVWVPGPPGADLLPLFVGAGALSAAPEVHDAQLHILQSAGLAEAHLRLPGTNPGSGGGDVPSVRKKHWELETNYYLLNYLKDSSYLCLSSVSSVTEGLWSCFCH